MRLTAAITFVGLALTTTPALAVPIIGSGNWQTGFVAHENMSAYWDGDSWDSISTFEGQALNPCSAGSLVGGAACGLSPEAAAAAANAGLPVSTFSMAGSSNAFEYWGNGNGTADDNFYFGAAGSGWYDFSLLGEFTSDWAINEVGWYDPSNPSTHGVIFADRQTVGAMSSVYIPGNFGLYYRNTSGNGEMFFTQTGLNTVGNRQQFAAFQIGDFNVVGIEDIYSNITSSVWTATSSDYDFNDVMIGFRATSAPVPEPGSLMLMGMGIAGVATRLRKRAKKA